MKRFMSIWFPYLITDWQATRRPELRDIPFVFTAKERGRMLITAANNRAEQQGIRAGMAAADAKAIVPRLETIKDLPGKAEKLLTAIGEWCIRYTPAAAVDMPDGLMLDISGCPHLWGGEQEYAADIMAKLNNRGYHVRPAIADTPGAARAIARFGRGSLIVEPGRQAAALLPLHPAALGPEPVLLDRLQKLGFYKIESLMGITRSVLRRRFGQGLLQKLDQALGKEAEALSPLQLVSPYEERLPCPEPIRTAKGIEIAIQKLLEQLCRRLRQEGKGMRTAILKCYRIDGKTVQVTIATTRASRSIQHLFKLFELKINQVDPALGIELFAMEATRVEDASPAQEALWSSEGCGLENPALAELLDRIAGKAGPGVIHRYLPQEHYWPERSIKAASSLAELPSTQWRTGRQRPSRLLLKPEPVNVSVPLPDYPPILFRYRNKLHYIRKADGPERIEREWWLDAGGHRDYYVVEDQDGARYWLFRSGHYLPNRNAVWFIHGFFA